MDELANTFGEDFVKDYKKSIAQRREQRNSVGEEQMEEIAHKAVNEGKFQDGDPTFQHTTEEGVTHDVYLMKLPEMEGKSIFGYVNELDTGAVTCPLDYLDEWWSCLFNDPEDLKQMTPGEHYIIIGQYDTWTNDETGETKEQVSPVRGVLTLSEAKELAAKRLDSDVNDDTPDTEDSQDSAGGDDSSDDDDDDSGGFAGFGNDGSDDDDEEEDDDGELLDYEDVADVVEALAEKDSAVWEVDEDDGRFDKLLKVVANRMELTSDAEKEEAADKIIQRIEEEDDEDEDEEDAIF